MATLYAKAAGGNWSAAGTWSTTGSAGGDSSGPPTAADNVIFESGSGNVTINAAAACRSLDMTSGTGNYAGTLTHNTGITLSIGDGTAGAGSVALKFISGATYTPADDTAAISFVSTSTTQQTVDFGSKTPGNVTFNGVGGKWALTRGFTTRAATTVITVTAGTLQKSGTADASGLSHSWGSFVSSNSNTRVITAGDSTTTITGAGASIWNFGTATNLTYNRGTSTINFTGANAQMATGNMAFYTINFTGSGAAEMINGSTGTGIVNLTRTGTAVKTDTFSLSTAGWKITGSLTLNGNSATNRLLIVNNALGTQTLMTITGATISCSNVDFRDQNWSVATNLSAITGGSGDCGGNTGITFTTSATQTWSGTSGGNWSANAWSGRVPLPQDDVVINNAFSASQTITADMPRLGRNIDFTGVTGSPALTLNTTSSIYGSLTLSSGLGTVTGTSNTRTFEGRGTYSFQTAGKDVGAIAVSMVGGTLNLQDALTSALPFTLNNGTFNTNNFSVTTLTFTSTNSATRVLNLGSSTWALTRTSPGTAWNVLSPSLTLNSGTSTILISDTSTADKTFTGAGLTYYNLQITGGGTGKVTINGSNTFNSIIIGAPKTVTFTSGTTQTVTNFVANGSSGNVITINSSTGGSAATLSKSSGLVLGSYLSIQDSTATGGAAWYAGNSTNVSGNTGWIFASLPLGSTGTQMKMSLRLGL